MPNLLAKPDGMHFQRATWILIFSLVLLSQRKYVDNLTKDTVHITDRLLRSAI